jgi:hypothetical protein
MLLSRHFLRIVVIALIIVMLTGLSEIQDFAKQVLNLRLLLL